MKEVLVERVHAGGGCPESATRAESDEVEPLPRPRHEGPGVTDHPSDFGVENALGGRRQSGHVGMELDRRDFASPVYSRIPELGPSPSPQHEHALTSSQGIRQSGRQPIENAGVHAVVCPVCQSSDKLSVHEDPGLRGERSTVPEGETGGTAKRGCFHGHDPADGGCVLGDAASIREGLDLR